MKHLLQASFGAALVLGLGAVPAVSQDTPPAGLRDRTIAYALSGGHWALYQSPDGKAECPQGVNTGGPRETFAHLFPNLGPVAGTQLAREAAAQFPMDKPEPFPFSEAGGKTGIGLNLDGKVDANDFTSPDGTVKGIDNQLFRALGCVRFFRGPDGIGYHFTDVYLRQNNYNRALIELTNVDSLANDDDVDVAIYRGMDTLMTDATGAKLIPGGLQRIDTKFGKKFESHMKGKIVDGVLITEPKDVYWPFAWFGGQPGIQHYRDMRFQMNLTEEGARGLMAGYTDVDTWYYGLIKGRSQYHLGTGTASSPAIYQAMRRLADAYPNEKGEMTAISWAFNLPMVQVFIDRPEQQIATETGAPAKSEAASRR
jgi:hypothetical protein